MTRDLATAFSPLEARAGAPGAPSRDRISLREHVRSVEIGAFQEERGAPQRLRFDVVVEVGRPRGDLSDDVDRILSYDTLVAAIDRALGEERLNLLETLAERVAALVLTEPMARRVFVRIEKLDRGPHALGVEIERRAEAEGAAALPETVIAGAEARPLVVHLSNAAIGDARLPRWLDQLEAQGWPVVLTVGLPDLPRPRSAHPMPQARIDLLALEQNAWVLAGRDRRCVVVETRTEIAHAIAGGRIVVWAPSKIVLDAVEAPEAGAEDAPAIAAWLGGLLGAARLLGLGAPVPGGETVALDGELAL
ncbi:diguanylate cyclase [Rhodovulum sp. 12E13]|uniref:dihydroneopterin aldolase n=1 Tax=Rhodovulum sp. 12E13 TaxID=2203891 RepID=UPI000E1828B5|nr:dihydroneopterin aldolase [Rhodovulum sp. 12E13]RDC73809.1 diguanylate cyclase [Rhodovulum sp. 12E13]